MFLFSQFFSDVAATNEFVLTFLAPIEYAKA